MSSVIFYVADKAREIMIAKALGEGILRHGHSFELRRTGDYGSGRKYEGPGFETDIACTFGVKGRSKQILKEHKALGLGVLFFDKGYTRTRGEKGHTEFTRISVNNPHPLDYMMREDRPSDRLDALHIPWAPRQNTPHGHILVATSSQKYNDFHGLGDGQEHAGKIVWRIRRHDTLRQVIYRPKPSADPLPALPGTSMSPAGLAIRDALLGASLLVTHGASAAMDAIIHGVPAISLGPSIARPVCGTDITDESVREPYWPTEAAKLKWARAVAYTQFTLDEMRNGVAFELLTPELIRQCGDLTPSARVAEVPRP